MKPRDAILKVVREVESRINAGTQSDVINIHDLLGILDAIADTMEDE